MSNTIARGFCPSCDDFRKVERQSPRYWVHIALCILTMGLWGFVLGAVFALNTGKSGKWICQTCGGKSIHEGKKLDVKLAKRTSEAKNGDPSNITWWESRQTAELHKLYRQEKKRKKAEAKATKKAAKA